MTQEQLENFRKYWALYHSTTCCYEKPTINYFRDRPWTFVWYSRCKSDSNKLIKSYAVEYWNGGIMTWSYHMPDKMFRFASKEDAEEFAKKYFWDDKDPWNKSYKIEKL